ncbi:SdrD B-like domain-containing protein [Nocardioides sp. GCM10027113]|uniref:SdrD B-like domain-containing protein n=1 Tax=unclassified Nocardioides TaxID=2615069 RepID=UPI003613776B
MTRSRDRATAALVLALVSTGFVTAVTLVTAVPAQAATNTLETLKVTSARTEPRAFGGAGVDLGDPITDFTWLINVDNTGTTRQRNPQPGGGCSTQDATYPASCDWASIMEVPEPSAVYAHGDQTDFAGAAGLDLPDGRYLISVMADGYKIDGKHFSVPLPDPGEVEVSLQPNPLPDSTLRARVFADVAPTNGTMDVGDAPLEGFQGHINDTLGEVTTDVYGNPLCTTYQGEDPVTHEIPLGSLDGDMLPQVDTLGGICLSDADGLLTIPHLGSNRYTTYVTPPDNETWIQTTTLEGNHDWDTWLMEGATGYDTEFVLAGEPVPQPIFGFAPPRNSLAAGGSAHIRGVVVGINSYTPPKGGSFDFWGGNTGTKVKHPINRPWLSLADLNDGDQAVWIGRGNADGSFDISGVPDGNYTLSWWDEPQDYNLNFINVTIGGQQNENMGNIPLNGWWTEYEGFVFNDTNRNGVRDAGENGIPNFTLTLRKQDNSLMDRGQNTAVTDANGHYYFESGYPLGAWNVMEAYSDSFYTTGITYQADNQNRATTIKGAGVDVSVMPIIGLGGRIDWGVHAYDPTGNNGTDPRNGGIVGTVSYDTTRNELDPQYAAAED